MGRSVLIWSVAATLLAIADTGAAERLEGGRYRIEVTLEVPNVLRPLRYGAVERCIQPAAADGTFIVIIADAPLADCPTVHHYIDDERFTVEVVCPKANTGRALASYRLGKAGFTGRIAITAGGKNMRFTEVQRAARVGDCP